MKKALALLLSDEELLELCRILIDQDKAGAPAFLDQHLKRKVNQALEGC
jgi:hypothetical protein